MPLNQRITSEVLECIANVAMSPLDPPEQIAE